jgi:hypothetical protein
MRKHEARNPKQIQMIQIPKGLNRWDKGAVLNLGRLSLRACFGLGYADFEFDTAS